MFLISFQLFYKWTFIMLSDAKSIRILFLLFSFTFYWSSSHIYSANVSINNAYLWDFKKLSRATSFKVKINQNLFDFDLDEIRLANDKWMNLIIK